ncbi:ABC transporter ATP-binding protein [Bacillus mobilis]|uniref:ABC transporter ATP-binding protein n=1 Tax=Bacillus mobilis TaxID=2026190 RepID=UPI002E24BD5C|nr:ABC transporter ATP-binding protein [Bacillus mobilis]
MWDIDKKLLLFTVVLNVLLGFMPALLLLATQFLINSVSAAWGQDVSIIVKGILILLAIYVVQTIIAHIKQHIEEVYRLKLAYSINVLLMEKSDNLSLEDFESSETYDQLQRAQNEANFRPYQIFSQILVFISSTVTFISTAMILVLWKWWIIACLLIIPLVSAVFFLKLDRKEFNIEWSRAPKRRKLWYLSFLLTKDITIKEIKLYNLGFYLIKQYKEIYGKFYVVDKELSRKRLGVSLFFQLINQFIMVSLIFFIVFAGFTKQIMIGTMVSFMQAVSATQTAWQNVIQQVFSMYENNLYMEQLFSYLDVEERDTNQRDEVFTLENIETIQFENVSFRYPGHESYALRNINFNIRQNEVIGIVGKNGSGKSTIVKLLTRLYRDYEGQIFINSIPIERYSIYSVRDRIGVVFQDFVKFELTARENIGFGDIQYLSDDTLLYRNAVQAGARDLIYGLEKGLDTQLGKWFPDGHQLSGGEWQKLAISRAITKGADMYILDEPSASLDPQAEKDVFLNFQNILDQKIGIYISHRFSTVKHASNIMVLHEGEVLESGTHEELLEQQGLYHELYYIQAATYLEKKSTEVS